jgi:DNA polymerase/3'-5' exonuclease PolX
MSTGTKRLLAEAIEDAERFQALFPANCYRKWVVAGSVRRRRPEVGDVEHVVEPVIGEYQSSDMFATPTTGNLLWNALDKMVELGQLSRNIYQTVRGPQERWGGKYRGISFCGFNHEIFLAEEQNWGSVLAIRTGPWELSRELVTRLQRYGYRNADGYVKRDGVVVPCETEEKFFSFTGMAFIAPEKR